MINLPANKTALLQEMEVGRRIWEDVLTQIDAFTLEEPGVEGSWSIKQIVAHILGYEQWALAFLTDLHDPRAGSRTAFEAFWQGELDTYRLDHPNFPARMRETDDDQTNAVVVATYDRFSASEVLERERQVYRQLLVATKAVSDHDFLMPWKPGARPLIAILPGQSYTHYQTHLPAIRRWLAARQ
jgi:Protein of unknown function (DUF1706)